jgi:hypothetical protein
METLDKTSINLIVLLVVLLVVTYFYNVYKAKLESENINFSYNQIKEFLSDTGKYDKPILWIFLNYEVNGRCWESFMSRTSKNLNQGYLYLTVKSIIERNKKQFHICFIDDNVFSKLLDDGYFKNMNRKAYPNKLYLRIYGMCNLLYTYGGVFVPASFICFNDLSVLLEYEKMFVGEFVNRSVSCKTNYFYPSYQLMGCRKGNTVMESLVQYLQKSSLHDYTDEALFIGKLNVWLNVHVKKGQIVLISGNQIGTKLKSGKPMNLEDFFSTNFVPIQYHLGIYIPETELLQRIQYGWFVRMSPKQVLQSSTFVGKMLLLANAEVSQKYESFFQIK